MTTVWVDANVLLHLLTNQPPALARKAQSLMRRAAEGSKIKGFDALLDGPSAVVHGQKISVSALARLLLDEKKANDKLSAQEARIIAAARSGGGVAAIKAALKG